MGYGLQKKSFTGLTKDQLGQKGVGSTSVSNKYQGSMASQLRQGSVRRIDNESLNMNPSKMSLKQH